MPSKPKRLRWSDLRPWSRWLVILALVDFVAFAVLTVAIGGDGLSGVERAGHYFVSNHGQLTEVSRLVWELSRAQAISLLVLWPLATISVAVDSLRSRPEVEDADDSFLGRKGAPPRRKGR